MKKDNQKRPKSSQNGIKKPCNAFALQGLLYSSGSYTLYI